MVTDLCQVLSLGRHLGCTSVQCLEAEIPGLQVIARDVDLMP